MKPRLLFYCQHILGMGHFIRSAALARGLAEQFEVHFINGGESIAGFELPSSIRTIQLPPVGSDAGLRNLHAIGGGLTLEETKEIRRRRLIEEYEALRPELLLVELFPFGRRKFKFELIPLLERARSEGSRTKIVCSLRDILVARRDRQAFEEETCRLIDRYFHLLLVHADPRLQRLDETFARFSDLSCPVVYTGLVAASNDDEDAGDETRVPEDLPPLSGNEKLIVASIGGGRVGSELIECAIEASRHLNEHLPHRLLIFTGPYFPESEFKQLMERLSGRRRVVLRRYTTSLISYLRAADLSLSMAGYNTCLDLIRSGVRAIVYPFEGEGEREQMLRARKLRALGLVEVIEPGELDPQRLVEKIWSALDRPRPGVNAAALDLGGVEKSAAALKSLLAAGSSMNAGAWAALDRRLARLEEQGREVEIFFRNDDVDDKEEALDALVDLFLDREAPLNLAIIPGRLTEAGIHFLQELLQELRRARRDLIELDQHGWLHVNHEASGKKCEFGPSRTYEEQLSDISAGRRRLEEAFGEDFSPVFVPPWNRSTEETLRALAALGFRAFSALGSDDRAASMGLASIPVTLDLYTWKGGPRMRSEAELIADLDTQLERGARIGIMLHHKVMDGEARRFVGRLLDALKKFRVAGFHTFESLMAKGASSKG